MGEHSAVTKRDAAVNDRLRVHYDVDLLVADTEQVVGFNQLEALVHQRRRVDRDLPAHLPGRVLERVRHADGRELLPSHAAERPAGGSDREALDRARSGSPFGGDQLVQRGVLGIDGQDLRPSRLGERHHQLASRNERLLVGEREVDSLAQRRDRGQQSG